MHHCDFTLIFSAFCPSTGKLSYPSRGSEDSDRVELLRQTDPVDYTAETVDPFEDYTRGFSVNANDMGGRYQSEPARPSSAGRYAGRATVPPPKGIFDDVWGKKMEWNW